MPIFDVTVPQLGEALQEVLVQKLLKRPGELIRRDEPIYVMETDKADMEVESPYPGILKEWLVGEGTVVSVGAIVARIEVDSSAAVVNPSPPRAAITQIQPPPPELTTSSSPERRQETPNTRSESLLPRKTVFVPPRTRAYCATLDISDEELKRIPAASGTLMPADVDRYLAAKSAEKHEEPIKAGTTADFRDYPLPARQRVFNFRLKRSAQLVVPGTMVRELDWQHMGIALKALGRKNPMCRASDFELFAYALVQAACEFPIFRSVLIGDDIVRQFEHLNLGVAVQRSDAELLMAVVQRADRLDFASLVTTIQLRVRQAMEGEDQVSDQVPLHLNYVSGLEVTHGTSVLVAPAVAVVFLGAPTGRGLDRKANLGVTFDHRLINGVTAANLLSAIVRRIYAFGSEDDGPQSKPSIWDTETIKTLREAGDKARRDILEKLLTNEVAEMLKVSPNDIDTREPLRMLGLSSIMAVELSTRVAANLNQNLPATLLYSYPSIAELAVHLTETTKPQAHVQESQAGGRAVGLRSSTILDNVEKLSEQEAEALVKEKVDRGFLEEDPSRRNP
jgi:pyruvate/2-oxoglutarate dehydrogenase complex dihydrolipoamide acyltransferase (E2) component/acyl carrier protein